MNNAILHKTAHVHALLHRNEFVASIIANHDNANRLLTEQEFDCQFWPFSFSGLTTLSSFVTT